MPAASIHSIEVRPWQQDNRAPSRHRIELTSRRAPPTFTLVSAAVLVTPDIGPSTRSSRISFCPREFLEDGPYESAEAFWADFAARFAAAGRVGGSAAMSAGDLERASQLFERVLACDPTDEDAARGLMRLYLESGDQSGARKVYRALEEALRRAFEDESIKPAEETVALLQGGDATV